MIAISKTKVLVKAALSGQKDWSGVSKYDHCVRVGHNMNNLLMTYKMAREENIIDYHNVALLHDIIEDSDITAADLSWFGYKDEIVTAVELLTHNEESSYSEYIDRICASGNLMALLAKLADNIDNTDPKRNEGLAQHRLDFGANRYNGVREKLVNAIEGFLAC